MIRARLITLLAVLFLAADPAGGQELIQLGPVGDTALLRYTLDYQIEANIDGSVPASRRTLHIL
ncbi:MAG: hypothetical protein NDJ18_07885, partial [candidate division Zixibacteria bacterium]|nr:hypothetical protein [candidate division Zixibacteria bacterium]